MSNVLVIGSGGGGRQHALGWVLARSPQVKKVYFAPGNGGTELCGENVPIYSNDFESLVQFAKKHNVDLTIVGPEAPLVAGIVDRFQDERLLIFGPGKAAAELEGSKAFAANFMERHDIPRPMSETVHTLDAAISYIRSHDPLDYVIKADGLAGGKGVILPASRHEAEAAITDIMRHKVFGASGNKVILQERLHGQEISAFALSDGKRIMMLPCFQDYKQAREGDIGPNTGGIGVYGPLPFVSAELMERIKSDIMQRTIDGMRIEGRSYRGVLYAGLFITSEGEPKVIEYNCRFGDPEQQALSLLLDEDIYPLLLSATTGHLKPGYVKLKPGAAAGVVLCSSGYPGDYEINKPIHGLSSIKDKDVVVFHGCTSRLGRRNLNFTDGGRVLTVSAYGEDIQTSLDKAYKHIGKSGVHFEDMHYRRDIGFRLSLPSVELDKEEH